MVMNPSKVTGHARFLLESFSDSEVDSIAQEIYCFAARRSHPNSSQLEKLISLVFKRVLKHSNLISHALQDVEVTDEFAADLTNALDFSISDKISFALSLVEFDSSDDANAANCFAARRSHPNSSQLEKLISLVFKRVLKHSNLISHALQDVEVTDEFAADLTNALDFSISDKISFALSLVEFDSSDDANAASKLPSSFRF
ncbi:hypothetical protein F2Q69_00025546 [Brassica cretica]|uniref:Uncharacterized protein n=1 Tax=Brassica cretica TaxID=69181 RepID=A0A8S9RSB6_BRACR|nr:hypothetical protein F2Q69_00025546 [Brassica cretica]